MESKSTGLGSIIGLIALCIVLYYGVMAVGNTQKVTTAVNYLQTGKTSLDYHQVARADATMDGIDPNLFERQINQESGFNPNAVSPAGAIGIAQIMPSTADGWHVDPHDPVQSLSAAALHMAEYYTRYQSMPKALAAYNCGTATLDTAIAEYGTNWRIGLPAETQTYIKAIMG